MSAKTDSHKLFFHKINTNQSEDLVIFGDKEVEKRRYVGGYVTEDDKYLIIQGANSTSGNDLYLINWNPMIKNWFKFLVI